jgi:hypothetical protein
LALLKGLPKQVLADYVVDSAAPLVTKVVSVVGDNLESNNFYRWTIEFHEHMGDVPLLQATTYFKCKGGAEINTIDPATETYTLENIDVEFAGDGPQFFMEIDGDISIATGPSGEDVWAFTVSDKNGNTILDPVDAFDDTVSNDYAIQDASSGFVYFNASNSYTRELAKVGLRFGLDSSDASRAHLNIKVHVDPVTSVRNSQYTLKAQDATRTIGSLAEGLGVFDIDVAGTAEPTYDMKHQLVIVSNDATTFTCRYMLNDEFVALVTISTTISGDPFVADTLTNSYFDIGFHTLTDVGSYVIQTVQVTAVPVGAAADSEVGDSFTWWADKDAVYSEAVPLNHAGSAAIESMSVYYTNQQAPSHAIPLVIQIAQTSGQGDLYIWKVAGDTEWVMPQSGQNGGIGFNIADNTTRSGEDEAGQLLGELRHYLDNMYPDDPMRQGLETVRIQFSEGSEHDQRLCASQAANAKDAKYYIQIGSQGLNDSPECSDRGICDYGSGTCRCFKGYAGIDCSEQNALSQGFAATTSAF